MSRSLPARPSLDHLKSQAKELLGDLERSNPNAKLADALHAIAREYGFATWPKLKEYVESLPRAVVAPTSPFVGSWTADIVRSKRHPANEFRSATMVFAIDGDVVTITDVVVDASGHEEYGENVIHVDGREHGAGKGYLLTARWVRSHAFETIATKDGEEIGRGTYEVSADGLTLTVSTAEQRLVLTKS